MSDLHVRYLLIGGGVAGGAAAEAIRHVDRTGSILLVGQESNRPYYRRLLGRDYLLGRMNHEALFLHPAAWYAQQRIDLHTGRAASHLDATRQVATLDNGEEISFDRLLIATGSSPQRLLIPGSDLPNVYYLRRIEDADRLRHGALQITARRPRQSHRYWRNIAGHRVSSNSKANGAGDRSRLL